MRANPYPYPFAASTGFAGDSPGSVGRWIAFSRSYGASLWQPGAHDPPVAVGVKLIGSSHFPYGTLSRTCASCVLACVAWQARQLRPLSGRFT